MKTVYLIIFLLLCKYSFTQDIDHTINNAIDRLQADSQFRHAIISLYVVKTSTGEVVYDKNSEIGLVPASCQKIVTSAATFELLGRSFNYTTSIYSDGDTRNDTLFGNLHIVGSGDPTLGSWRWESTKEQNIMALILKALNDKHVKYITGGIYFSERSLNSNIFSYQPIPDGWVWQDIGNYYGAGAWSLNWLENQYGLHLQSGDKPGDSTVVISTDPVDLKKNITNFIRTGPKNSGDNGYIYAAPYSNEIYTTGTIPAGENDFVISGSLPNPPMEFVKRMGKLLTENKITYNNVQKGIHFRLPFNSLLSIVSPPLDSMNYWFLKKSINLYGEAFVKTIAIQKRQEGSTANGVEIIRSFWEKQGIERSALNIIDGSGLSPANRVTTHALVDVLQFAKKQYWFNSFYEALPELNGIKMKDGYITGVRSYAGYIKAKDGTGYTFSFIVNNVDGNPGAAREKIWKLLDVLK